jgi:hypothetical protein
VGAHSLRDGKGPSGFSLSLFLGAAPSQPTKTTDAALPSPGNATDPADVGDCLPWHHFKETALTEVRPGRAALLVWLRRYEGDSCRTGEAWSKEARGHSIALLAFPHRVRCWPRSMSFLTRSATHVMLTSQLLPGVQPWLT